MDVLRHQQLDWLIDSFIIALNKKSSHPYHQFSKHL